MIFVGVFMALFSFLLSLYIWFEDGFTKTVRILISLILAGVILIVAEVSIYRNNVENRLVETVIANQFEINDETVIQTDEPMYIEHWYENDFGYPTILAGDHTYKVYTLEQAEELGKDIENVKKVFIPAEE